MGTLTPEQRRKVMRSIHSQDTKAEVMLRKALYHAGYRYRKNWSALPGKPDIVLTRQRICIFVDSEFFHGKDYETKRPVMTNAEYWDRKIRRNMERDLDICRQLRAMDWTVIRFWDKEVTSRLGECVASVKEQILEKMIENQE